MNVPVIRGVATGVWVLRAVALAGPLVALWSAAPAGFVPSPFTVIVVALGSVAYALRPDHLTGPIVMSVVLFWWALSVGSTMPAGSLVAAAALMAAHVAGVLLGYGPTAMEVDLRLARLWAVRGAVVWLAAPVVWFTAQVYSGRATPTLFWLGGLATALVGAVVAAVAIPMRDLGERQ
jgi:hypothetical protein